MTDFCIFFYKFIADTKGETVIQQAIFKRILHTLNRDPVTAVSECEKGYLKAGQLLNHSSSRISQSSSVFPIQKPDRMLMVDGIGHGLKISNGMIQPAAQSAEDEKLVEAFIHAVFQADHRIGIIFFRSDSDDVAVVDCSFIS